MINTQKLIIEHFVEELQRAYHRNYGIMEPHFGDIVAWSGRLALENIANSDALYHDVSHTMNVTLVGQAILQGKHLSEGGVSPHDWLHFMMALIFHDIGYVRGICQGDRNGVYASGIGEETVALAAGSTDAALTSYHVNRSKLFVRERFDRPLFVDIDTERIASYIEMTRFPPQSGQHSTSSYGILVRAADFIGQLGDPNYLRKIPALFYEFQETGINGRLGYETAGDLRRKYARFYWDVVSPDIQDALRYLRITQEGKQWIASLFSHVFAIEHNEIG